MSRRRDSRGCQRRAPAIIRTQYRAVTAQDRRPAMPTPGLSSPAPYALLLHHPTLSVPLLRAWLRPPMPVQRMPFPGVVTVLVIPTALPPVPRPPKPRCGSWPTSDSRRLVTTEVWSRAPTIAKWKFR